MKTAVALLAITLSLVSAFSKRKPSPDPGRGERGESIWADEYTIIFSAASPRWRGTNVEGKSVQGRVYVVIKKKDKKFGSVRISKFHTTGQRIGWWRETNVITSKHPARVGDRTEMIDLDTDLTITAITEKKIPIVKRVCTDILRDKFNLSAGKCNIKEKLLFELTIREVRYQNSKGKKFSWRDRDTSTISAAKPDYCGFHRKNPPKKLPSGDGKLGEYKSQTPRELFNSIQTAWQKEDWKALWKMARIQCRAYQRKEARQVQSELRRNPDFVKTIKRTLSLEKDPRKMKPEELAIAAARQSLIIRFEKGSKLPDPTKITKTGETAQVLLVIPTKGTQKKETLKFEKQSNGWRFRIGDPYHKD